MNDDREIGWHALKLAIFDLLPHNIAGILVRSFAPGCPESNRNLGQWPNAAPHLVKVIDDPGRLPKTRNSWYHRQLDKSRKWRFKEWMQSI